MASSALELQFHLHVFRLLLTIHVETSTNKMRPQSSHAMLCFTCVYLHTQTAVNAGDIRTCGTTVILVPGNPKTPIWAPCREKWCRFWDLCCIAVVITVIHILSNHHHCCQPISYWQLNNLCPIPSVLFLSPSGSTTDFYQCLNIPVMFMMNICSALVSKVSEGRASTVRWLWQCIGNLWPCTQGDEFWPLQVATLSVYIRGPRSRAATLWI